MASNLNVFKTVTSELAATNTVIYTAPTGVTSIILMAQVSNVSVNTAEVTFSHFDTSASVETELVKDFSIPAKDATSVITGKLVLESGDSVKAFSSDVSTLKLSMSLLETLNA